MKIKILESAKEDLKEGFHFYEFQREVIIREPFDYTKWQRDLWPDEFVEELSKKAMEAIQMKNGERIRIDCESEANHDLIRLLDKPGIVCVVYI